MSKTLRNGFLLIDKPAGPTSHDIVARVRRLLAAHDVLPTKVGHTGTLDPFATGLLIITLGSAARLAEYTHAWRKTYHAVVRLGAVSDTDDAMGKISATQPATGRQPTSQEIAAALQHFQGSQLQLPPAYAAIKVHGKKMYELARQGRALSGTPRRIVIDSIRMESYAYPHLALEVVASTGTYIRALARDIGQQLATGAYCAQLRRTAIGPFDVALAMMPNSVTAEALRVQIHPAAALVQHLPHVQLPQENVAQFITGQSVQGRGDRRETAAGPIAVFTARGDLLGIARHTANNLLMPEKVLSPPRPTRD